MKNVYKINYQEVTGSFENRRLVVAKLVVLVSCRVTSLPDPALAFVTATGFRIVICFTSALNCHVIYVPKKRCPQKSIVISKVKTKITEAVPSFRRSAATSQRN